MICKLLSNLTTSISVKCGIHQGYLFGMLLFIIGIEPLTRNILPSSQIQGLLLGEAALKVSHYADDLTLFITHPTSFQSLSAILNQFSLYSGLKTNNRKIKILSNCPYLLSSFKLSFPHCKIMSSTKILGIHVLSQDEEMTRNWDELIQSVPHATLTLFNLDDSLYSKVISINQHLSTQILFYAKIIPPTAKQKP